MRILLLAMPDTASSLDRVMKFPNLGLCYNGYMVNVRTRHLGSAQVARAMLWESLKLYYDPRAARRSRFFRDFPAFRGRMLLNNLALFAGARNRLFHSTHTV